MKYSIALILILLFCGSVVVAADSDVKPETASCTGCHDVD